MSACHRRLRSQRVPRLGILVLIGFIFAAQAQATSIARDPEPADWEPKEFPRAELRHTTAHYDIRMQGTEGEADVFGRVLEAAWPTFKQFFHGEPPLKEGERLAIRIFENQESCLVGAMNEKADMPPIKYPAWFSQGNGAVYLYRFGGDWFTRYLVIYGACLQFHGLTKSRKRDLDEWYVHGIAESFAVHSWDGEHLELSTNPPIAALDHPARALAELGGKQIGLDPFTDERLNNPSVRWAVVRFVTSTADGRYRGRFEKLALGATGSKMSGHDFMRSLGQEREISQEFSAWLLGAQMPLEVIDPDWEAISDGRIVGRSKADEQALCAAKPEFSRLKITVDSSSDPDAGVPGILFSFQDDRNYVVARIRTPVVFFEHVQAGRRGETDSRPIDRPGPKTFVSVVRTSDTVELEINGKAYEPLRVPDGRLGFVAIGGRVTFRDLSCK